MPKMKVSLGIGYSNSNQEDIIEIDEDEWNECETDEDRADLMNDYWKNWADNFIDGGTEIID
jgi:hypothetical protein